MFYVDHYITEDVLAMYCDVEEFIFKHDKKMIDEKNIDFYIGHLIKHIETQYAERIKDTEEKKIEIKKGDPDVLIKNPGSVTFEDLQIYLAEKAKNRYSIKGDLEKE